MTVLVKEIGSGVNDSRPKLLKLLTDPTITLIVVEHKDRLTRFGFNYIEQLLAMQGRRIEVINQAENGKEDLVQDFVTLRSRHFFLRSVVRPTALETQNGTDYCGVAER